MFSFFKKSKKDNECCNVMIEEVKEDKKSCCNVKIEEVVETDDKSAPKSNTSSCCCSSKTE